MRHARAIAIGLLSLLTASQVVATEQSTRLYSRGLVEFHATRYTEALTLFNDAVAADPSDVYALYYRAVTRGRVHDMNGAIADLRAALAAKPDFDQAALELGVALVQTGAYREALPWLEQGQRAPESETQASLFLGLAQLRLGQRVAARQNFRRAAKDPAQALTAEYYEGIIDYQDGDWASAEGHFIRVIRDSPESEIAREAGRFLKRMRPGQIVDVQLYGALGVQYDSNVVLAPSNDAIKTAAGISNQSDGRVTISVGGSYPLVRTEHTQLSIGYDFYQSLHFNRTDFNLQDHGPSLQLVTSAGALQIGIAGRFDYYLLDSSSFLQEATALPWVTILEANRGRTELFYRMRRRDFLQEVYWVRDAFNHSPGFRQYLYVDSPEHYVVFGYRFDREDPIAARDAGTANSFAYDGHEIDGGIGWTFPFAITADLNYAYRYERYAPPSHGRRDDEHNIILIASKRVTEHLDLTAGYFGTINNSTDGRFEYDRHVVSLAAEVRF